VLGFPSLRVNHTNSLHHLWCNNGTWWVHYTLHFDHRKRRIRRSLKTSNLAEAVRRRDELLAEISIGGEVIADQRQFHGRELAEVLT
jgi:ligand-binding sensor domain-containing protein